MRRGGLSLGRIFAWITLLLMIAMFVAPRARAACTTQGCLMAGPRLASLSTAQSTLLSPLMQALLGTSVTATALDWQQVAGADIKIASFANALQAQTSAGSPNAALTGTATLAQVFTAAANAATNENNTALASVITNLTGKISVAPGAINLANMFKTSGNLGESRINVLDLITGVIEAHNYDYGVNTPAAVSVGTPGLLGVSSATLVTIQARVVEPPVYYCGDLGTTINSPQFHTAALRLKINITIPQPAQVVNYVIAPGVVSSSDLTVLPNFSVYVNVARADGYISQLSPLAGAAGTMTVRVRPGVTGLYMGSITDSFFFTRTNGITGASFGFATIADTHIKLLAIPLVTGTIQLKAVAEGTSPVIEDLVFTGPYPQTLSTLSSLNSATALVTQLLGSGLQLNANVNLLGLLNLGVVTGDALAPILAVITAPVTQVVSLVADPLLTALGIKIGQAVVTAYGAFNLCNVTGHCYDDANHSFVKDPAERGTAETLQAKLVATASPTQVYASTPVDPVTGVFSFSGVQSQGSSGVGYTLLIDTNATATDVTPTRPTGWISTQTPTFSQPLTVTSADVTATNFGLYHGSSLTGRVFVDAGAGGGVANNVVRDGAEAGLPGARVNLTDNTGATVYDSAVTGDGGAFTLWIPSSATGAVQVTELNPNTYLSTGGVAGDTGGAYARATDTVTFTHLSGSAYSGVNFGDVPAAIFLTDGRQAVLPGSVAFYPHAFTAGTAGSVTFAATAPAMAGWSHSVFEDANCNGAVDSGEAFVAAPRSVVAAQKVCLVVRVFASQVAAYNDEYPVTLGATFAWSGSAYGEAASRNDLTVVGSEQGAGLHLVKSVDRATATSGQALVYTITYTNFSSGPLTQVQIHDHTPAYTVYASGACGTLGAGLSGCAVTSQPTAGQSGGLSWALAGALAPGATGTVTFTVTLQ